MPTGTWTVMSGCTSWGTTGPALAASVDPATARTTAGGSRNAGPPGRCTMSITRTTTISTTSPVSTLSSSHHLSFLLSARTAHLLCSTYNLQEVVYLVQCPPLPHILFHLPHYPQFAFLFCSTHKIFLSRCTTSSFVICSLSFSTTTFVGTTAARKLPSHAFVFGPQLVDLWLPHEK